MNKVLVTGGTGDLGKHVVDYLLKKHYPVCVLTSKEIKHKENNISFVNGDLASNTGLTDATSQVETIIHCASNSRDFERVDVDGTRRLLQSVDRATMRHFIYISIVGVNKSAYPYYQAKFAVEKLIANSAIPFTILRTTQFHGFVLNMLQPFVNDQADEVVSIPTGMKFQSIDIREVATQLVDKLEQPAGLLPDFGGPQILSFENMVQSYLEVTNASMKTKTSNMAGERFDLFRSGVNLCPENAFGKLTWQSFLEEQFSAVTRPGNSH